VGFGAWLQAKSSTLNVWHMDQPVYWDDRSHTDPEKKQDAQESNERLPVKMAISEALLPILLMI